MAKVQKSKRSKLPWLGAAIAVAIGSAATWHFTRPDEDSLRVPLGVEQAAIVTYSGPRLAVAPYKWGVAVNVRIAEVLEQPDRRIYDLRYIVNRAGTFDLRDYLAAEDGGELAGLPSFEFTGDSQLSKELDTRIEETEEVRVEVGGRYFETLAALTALWIAWLLLLIFYKRPKPPAEAEAAPPEPTLAEQLRGYLAQLEAGSLDATGKARMEMAMLQCWRSQLDLGDRQMADSIEQISRDDATGEPLRKLQHWLHHPASTVAPADIAAVIKPYTEEAAR